MKKKALFIVILTTLFVSSVFAADIAVQLESLAQQKKVVLDVLDGLDKEQVKTLFNTCAKGARRHLIMDGEFNGISKPDFLKQAIDACKQKEVKKSLKDLLKAHEALFADGNNKTLQIRLADSESFSAFGKVVPFKEAIGMITNYDSKVQAFKTIFETGENTRGYVHKMENHATCTEFVVAVSDIIYGMMLIDDLEYEDGKVLVDPQKVQFFYIKAGDAMVIDPLAMHSGSLAVEKDGIFSIFIYKPKLPADYKHPRPIPEAWEAHRGSIELPGIDKYYMTLEELHTGDLKDNQGFVKEKLVRLVY